MSTIETIITQLADHYEQSVHTLQTAIRAFVEHGTPPDPDRKSVV